MAKSEKKSIGAAIDEIITALTDLDEPTRTIAVKAACEHLNISLGGVSVPHAAIQASASAPVTPAASKASALPTQSTPVKKDIRTFKDEKNPSNGMEMTCLVAYYLENLAPEGEVVSDINKKDLEKYFKQAGFPLPKAVGQTLIDAKSAGYMDASSTRGRYKLNPVGHNLIAHSLPRKQK